MTWIGWLGPRSDGSVSAGWLAMASLGDEQELEDVIERAWLARVWRPPRKRSRFHDDVLAQYPLTQPEFICQRCNRAFVAEGARWDLDHIVELQYGGLDHPSNLVRLCVPCHRSKPLPPESILGDTEAMRRYILAWVRMGPPGGVREHWDWDMARFEAEDPEGYAEVTAEVEAMFERWRS